MKKIYVKNQFILVFLTVCLTPAFITAQQFRRIEVQANLGHLANTNGVAVADFDQDNDLDILIVGEASYIPSNPNSLVRLLSNNNDGSFTDITESSNIEQGFFHDISSLEGFDVGDKMAASWGDYDNDGYPDFYISSAVQSQLYHNNGNGTFTNVTDDAGLESYCENCYFSGATWWDYDNDGLLDLYITDYNFISDNKLYRNLGNGSFDLISDVNIAGNSNSFSSIPVDANGDEFMDLYIANDFDQQNFLLINQNGNAFTEEALDYGLGDFFDGMGLATSDYDNDGLFEILITNIKENGFYVNDGNDNYVQTAEQLGIYDTDWSWGALFSDFNFDGYEDLLIANGFTNNNSNDFFVNIPDGGMRDFVQFDPTENPVQDSTSRSVVAFDFDNDGDEDIIVSNFRNEVFLYENRSVDTYFTNDTPGNWLKVHLEGTISNRNAFGSKVELQTTDLLQHRWYHGAGYQSQSIKPIHFGLANATNVQSIAVTWPNGVTEVFNNIDINQTIKIVEGNGLTIEDNNTAIKIPGCTNQDSCNYDELATVNDGSCVFLDQGSITGNTTVFPLSEEVYSYGPSIGDFYEWTVTNGEIIAGAGTNAITVKWNVASHGSVSIINRDENCATEAVTLDVTIEVPGEAEGDFSIARFWNELLLEAIRNDFARPTVHARNLFHTSAAMYDSWAIYDEVALPYFLGNTVHGFTTPFDGFTSIEDATESVKKTISYAAYRILRHRFIASPGGDETLETFDDLMNLLGYDTSFDSVDYSTGNPAALGNYIADKIIEFGLQDGSNEGLEYGNLYYEPVNDPLIPDLEGNPNITDPNRWQPLSLEVFIDQSGNILEETTPEFLSPEWGNALPFSLTNDDLSTFSRDGDNYNVFYDPGAPPYIGDDVEESDLYKWGFSLVSVWQSHLDPTDGVMWDISPRSIGNIDSSQFPTEFSDYDQFYNLMDGGDISVGHATNPVTGQAYEPQLVPRGDYTRILAEFWADGPDSETPPGHWFTILNYVSDNPLLEKKINGEGETVSNLEWDVKTYFALGGAMHDSAIAAWGVKGWYDYIRPISAIRYMADQGQSTDNTLSNYNANGIPLIEGLIEVVQADDPLVDIHPDNEGKIKLYTWRGHTYIENTEEDVAGVGWILAENWWPYQRPSFVTPPFAGYVSGHSTYSRAAAEMMTQLTGSAFFPGGIGEFEAKENEFLVFEDGPSQDVILQWATYRDASDQCSLSRIWGGIHPPMDDIPGRLIGEQIGNEAYELAEVYFNGIVPEEPEEDGPMVLYPNPIENFTNITITNTEDTMEFALSDIAGRLIPIKPEFNEDNNRTTIFISDLSSGIYFLRSASRTWKIIVR